jgi:hypothetical protein
VRCPNCNLINPPNAERCDCGYDFESKTVQASYIKASRGIASRLSRWGRLLTAIALVAILLFTVGSAFATDLLYDILGALRDLATLVLVAGLTSWLLGALRDRSRPVA